MFSPQHKIISIVVFVRFSRTDPSEIFGARKVRREA